VFDAVVPPLARAFHPDVIVTQHGCDPHYLDPLTHLALTTAGLEIFSKRMDALSAELCDGRWLALGGGGYEIWQVVPRVWALVWSAVSGQRPPAAIPAPWVERWQELAPGPLPEEFRETAGAGKAADRGVENSNLSTAKRALSLCLPHVRR
ncbi:MAG: hypothetical protein WD535_05725, partial [Thermaerobacterales bacterium]